MIKMINSDEAFQITSKSILDDWQPIIDKSLAYVEMQVLEKAKCGEFNLLVADTGTDNSKVNILVWDVLRKLGYRVWRSSSGFGDTSGRRLMNLSWLRKKGIMDE